MSKQPHDYYFQSSEDRTEYLSRITGLGMSLLSGSFLGCLFSIIPAVGLSFVIGVIDIVLTITLNLSLGVELAFFLIGFGTLLTHHNLVRIFEGTNYFGSFRGERFRKPPPRHLMISFGNTLIFTGVFQFITGVAEGLFQAIF